MKYRLKVRQPLTSEQQASLIADHNSGMALKDIQSKYQISRTTIYNTLHKE